MKHICKRDFMRNGYKALSDEPTIVTNNGQPQYFIGSISTIEGYNKLVTGLNDFANSLNISSDATVSYAASGIGGGIGNASGGNVNTSMNLGMGGGGSNFLRSGGGGGGGSAQTQTLPNGTVVKPIVVRNRIKYEKTKHSHK